MTAFCDQKLLDDLGVEGEHAIIALTTVNETAQNCESKKLRLTMSGLDSNSTVELNEVFSVKALPIKSNKSLTVAELKMWPHLKSLKIPPSNQPQQAF